MQGSTHNKTMTLTIYTTTLLTILCLLSPIPATAQPTPRNPDPYAYAKFSPSMAIIIVILIAALFFIAFFSIYIRHCSSRTTASSASAQARATRRVAPKGLDQETIQSFPTLVYSMVKNLKIGKGALECAVCLSEFEDHETLRLIPKCDHVFHVECIGEWLANHTTCPVCRADLKASDGDQERVDLGQQEEVGQVIQERVEESGPQVIVDLNRYRTSRVKFPRSHSTGHSLVQPGENTERFTLRLPAEVRKQIMDRRLGRASSMVLLPREGSSRRGYRTGSSRGKYYRRIEELEQDEGKSERRGFGRVGPFLSKMSSSVRSLSRSFSVRSKSVRSGPGECSSCQSKEPEVPVNSSTQFSV